MLSRNVESDFWTAVFLIKLPRTIFLFESHNPERSLPRQTTGPLVKQEGLIENDYFLCPNQNANYLEVQHSNDECIK